MPTTTADTKTRPLRQAKAAAFLVLLLSLALLLLSAHMKQQGLWAWAGAFAQAATIGALASWFVTTALFRRPLGLPFAYTALVARLQSQIAQGMGQFMHNNFLDKEALIARTAVFNPAQKLGSSLSNPAQLRSFTAQLQDWAASSFKKLDNPAIERELCSLLQRELHTHGSTPAVEQMVRLLKPDQNPQPMLDCSLRKIIHWASTPSVRKSISEEMVEAAKQQYPKLLWLTDQFSYTENIAETLAAHLSQSIVDEAQSMLFNPHHPLRVQYCAQSQQVLLQITGGAIAQAQPHLQKELLMQQPALQTFVASIWPMLRDHLAADLQKPDSHLASRFIQYASFLGSRLRHDTAWQSSINNQMQTLIWHLTDHLRQIAPEHIRNTIQGWNTKYLVNEVERNIGRDLQYIRISATLAAGIAGVGLHALQLWLK